MPRYSPAPYIGPPAHFGSQQTAKHAVTIHCTDNDAGAIQEATYAQHRPDDVSSHFYVDNSMVIQSLDTSYVAWHAGSEQANTGAVAIEITGLASWSEEQWRSSVNFDKLADLIAWLSSTHTFVPYHPSRDELRQYGPRGIFTHADATAVWGSPGSHTDPGPNFPLAWLIDLVLSKLGQPPTPTPPEDDDMPAFQTGQLRDGLGNDHATMLTIPPVSGGAGWGPAWLSFGCDLGSAKLRVAVHVGGKGWQVVEGLTLTAQGDRAAWKAGGELPAGAGKVSIIRVPISPADNGAAPVAWLLEYGRR